MSEQNPAVPAEPPPARPSVKRVLLIVALVNFAASLFVRVADPIIPKIADDFAMDAATVALLSTAFAMPYAVVQPVLGAMGDMLGKTRLITICLLLLVISAVVGAFAPNYTVLLVTRVIAGIVTGGIFPVSLALTGDLVPVSERQVAISRLLAAAMMGNLLGSPGAGVVADLIGWRGVFIMIAAVGAVAVVAAFIEFRAVTSAERPYVNLAEIPANYRIIFANPLAKFCFGSVLLEGIFVFGLFPYVATLLHASGETRASIAGIVLAGFALGGVVYAMSVRRLLAALGERWLMISGGSLISLGLLIVPLRLPWQAEMANFAVMGCGFYMLHGVIQIYVSELAPHARASAMALHSAFFFTGHALGPIYYRYGLVYAGLAPCVILGAVVVFCIGLVCAKKLRRRATA